MGAFGPTVNALALRVGLMGEAPAIDVSNLRATVERIIRSLDNNNDDMVAEDEILADYNDSLRNFASRNAGSHGR